MVQKADLCLDENTIIEYYRSVYLEMRPQPGQEPWQCSSPGTWRGSRGLPSLPSGPASPGYSTASPARKWTWRSSSRGRSLFVWHGRRKLRCLDTETFSLPTSSSNRIIQERNCHSESCWHGPRYSTLALCVTSQGSETANNKTTIIVASRPTAL